MCQAFIGKISFRRKPAFKMRLSGLRVVYAYSKAHRRAAVLAYSHSNQKLLPEPRSIERHSSLNQVPAAADKEEVWQ